MVDPVPSGVTRVLDDVYDITCREAMGRRYRAYLVDEAVPTLVDTTHVEYADRLLDRLDAMPVAPQRLIVTHGDNDHAAAIDEVVDAFGVETWVPAELEPADRAFDHRYADGDQIGGFTAVHVPGHTPDSYVLVDEDRSMAVMGDAVVGSDVRGLPPGYLVAPPEVWTDDLHAAERNLKRLLEYEFEVALVFHGTSVTERARDRLDAYVNFPQDRPRE